MHTQNTGSRPARTFFFRLAGWMAVCMLFLALVPGISYAGKEGVFLNDSVYFTLEQVTVSSGADYSTMQFTVALNNNGGAAIDYNRFGVRVTTGANSYSAQLNRSGKALVTPNSAESYDYMAKLPVGLKPDELYVTVFEWAGNTGQKRDMGSLSVAKSESLQQKSRQLTINMRDVDPSLPDDAITAFETARSYKILKDGIWNIYVDLMAENLGSSSFKIPDGLQFSLQDSNGVVYSASVSYGSDQILLPKQSSVITVQTPVGSKFSTETFSLQFSKNKAVKTNIGSLSLSGTSLVAAIREKLPYYFNSLSGVTIAVENIVSARINNNEVTVQSTVVLRNEGDGVIALPELAAQYQLSGLAMQSGDQAKHPALLAPKTSEAYRFSAVLPAGIDLGALQLAIMEKKKGNTAAAIPVIVSKLEETKVDQRNEFLTATAYDIGSPILLDPLNNAIPGDIQLTLVELNAHDNEDLGYKTVVAKYKLVNKGNVSYALPAFETELINPEGFTYAGSRQNTNLQQLLPNLGYVITYAYLVPAYQDEEQFILKIKDGKALTSIAKYKVAVQEEESGSLLSFYPFKVDIKDWLLSSTYNTRDATYAYRLRLDMDIQRQENIVADANFSKMEIDLVDGLGRVVGTQTLNFTGTGRLVSGQQTITFNSLNTNQLDFPITVKMYESVATSSGTVKRLVKTFKQQ